MDAAALAGRPRIRARKAPVHFSPVDCGAEAADLVFDLA